MHCFGCPIGESTFFCGCCSFAMSMRQRRALDLFLGSGRCQRALASWGRESPSIPTSPLRDQVRIIEKRWQQFFSDPSHWWDHRSDKTTTRYPDFTHKKTKEGLWIQGRFNPQWVEAELSTMVPGTVQQNAFSWNLMLSRYVRDGQNKQALELFQQMKNQDICLDKCTFIPVLKACGCLEALEQGRNIHAEVIQSGCESDVFVGTSLLDMYAKCGSIEEAQKVFDKMPRHDLVAWNAMIQGYVKCGQGHMALEVFQQMQSDKVDPDPVTFVGVLNACASIAALEEGRHIHGQIIQSGCEVSLFVGNSLVDMYAKCGSIDDAWTVFSKMPACDVVTWNAMIVGYVKCGQALKALELYQQMQNGIVKPDLVTFVAVLNACAGVKILEEGLRVHAQIIESGCESNLIVGNSLIDMYAKCGSIDDAWRVFTRMGTHDVITWNAMIMGYVKCGLGQRALELSQQMLTEGLEPDPVTFVGVLTACASIAALEEGRCVHVQIIHSGCEENVFVKNSLIDMYSKCGSIEDAWRVFNKMHTRDTVTWNAMLGGYATHGQAKEALQLFEWMCRGGVEMDRITFVSLISACSYAGLVEEGLHYFQCMNPCYGIALTMEHYGCMVDLLGRAGRLHEAEDMIKTMLLKPNVVVWKALLGASIVHGNVEMGERIAKQVLEMDPGNSSGYVLLSNIYAAAGKWDSREIIHKDRMENGVMKQPVHGLR